MDDFSKLMQRLMASGGTVGDGSGKFAGQIAPGGTQAELDALLPSILDKAFKGELQDRRAECNEDYRKLERDRWARQEDRQPRSLSEAP